MAVVVPLIVVKAATDSNVEADGASEEVVATALPSLVSKNTLPLSRHRSEMPMYKGWKAREEYEMSLPSASLFPSPHAARRGTAL